jgi:hypothetical protein
VPDRRAPDEGVLDEDVAAFFDEAERQLAAGAATGEGR